MGGSVSVSQQKAVSMVNCFLVLIAACYDSASLDRGIGLAFNDEENVDVDTVLLDAHATMAAVLKPRFKSNLLAQEAQHMLVMSCTAHLAFLFAGMIIRHSWRRSLLQLYSRVDSHCRHQPRLNRCHRLCSCWWRLHQSIVHTSHYCVCSDTRSAGDKTDSGSSNDHSVLTACTAMTSWRYNPC